MSDERYLIEMLQLADEIAAAPVEEMRTLAGKVAANTATAAEQRRGLELALRTSARYARAHILCLHAVVRIARALDAAPGSILLRREEVNPPPTS